MATELLGVLILLASVLPPLFLIRKGSSSTSPFVLIWISQTTPLGVALLNVTGEMTMPRATTWIVLGISFVAILAGNLVAVTTTRNVHRPSTGQLSEFRLTLGVYLLAGMYFLSILQGVAQTGGFPILLPDPGEARLHFVTGRMQNIFFSAAIPLFILSIHLIRITGSRIKRIAVIGIFLGLIVTYLLIGSRFMTLTWLCMSLIYWDQVVKRIPLLRITVLLLLFLAAFVLIGYLRYGRMLAVASGSSKVFKVGGLLALQSVYTYIANAYWNLDFALLRWNLGELAWPTWGFSMNEGVFWILGFGPDIQKAYGWTNSMNDDVMLQAGLNATTYHWGLFKDFGLAGPVVGSFAMGWLFTLLYNARCRTGSPASIMIYGLLSYFLLGSFNLLPTVIPTPVFGLLLLVGSLYLCSVPRPNINS